MTGVNIESQEARDLIIAHLGDAQFDIDGMNKGLVVIRDLINSGQIVHNCPDNCGGAQ